MKLTHEIKALLENRDQLKKMFNVGDDAFEKSEDDHSVKTLIKTKEGYAGFSHRAVAEFKIGDKLFDPEFGVDDMDEDELDKLPFKERGSITIKTMEQCKESAKNFADYVS
jgi:hypothetical protein